MTIHTTLAVGGNDVVSVGDQPLHVVKLELDMADVAANVTSFSTGDSITVLTLPTDTYFELIKAYCRTALAGITRVDIGDEAQADEMVSNATTVAAGTYFTIAKATHTDGIITQAASQINVKLTGTPSTGILEIVALVGSASANTPAGPRTYPN